MEFSTLMEWLPGDLRPMSWLGWVRLAANLTILAAIASIVHTLYPLSRRHASGRPAPRGLVILFTVSIAICGLCHLGRALGIGPAPDLRPGAICLRIVIALLWLVVAVKLPALVASLIAPLTSPGDGTYHHQSMAKPDQAADELEDRILMKNIVVPKEPQHLGVTNTAARLENLVADRECDQ
jgi:hypothetical protein